MSGKIGETAVPCHRALRPGVACMPQLVVGLSGCGGEAFLDGQGQGSLEHDANEPRAGAAASRTTAAALSRPLACRIGAALWMKLVPIVSGGSTRDAADLVCRRRGKIRRYCISAAWLRTCHARLSCDGRHFRRIPRIACDVEK